MSDDDEDDREIEVRYATTIARIREAVADWYDCEMIWRADPPLEASDGT